MLPHTAVKVVDLKVVEAISANLKIISQGASVWLPRPQRTIKRFHQGQWL